MLTPTASHPDITKTGDYIFRNTPIAEFEANAVADWGVKDIGAKRVALIGRNDDYGRVQNDFFAARSKADGAEVVANELINPNDKDFKPLITNIRSKNPDVTMLAMFQVEAALLLQQSKEMGFQTTFMSGAGLFNPQLISLAGDAANGMLVVSTFYAGDTNPTVQSFVKAYQAKYNAVPSKFVAHTYDAVMMIADAIQRAGSADGPKVRDALAATNGYNGVIGKVTFDKNREVVLDLQRLMVANKEFVPWKKS
jgi:branched-chain amino acid transport system substrate-binding protein